MLSKTFVPGEFVGQGPCTLLVLGEAPGAEEDKQRRPFVGPSGKLLRWALSKALPDVPYYLTNVVKYRPDENATPTKQQIADALPALGSELAEIAPEIIITLGNTATQLFLPKAKINSVMGKRFPAELGNWEGTVVPCLHPAAVLRNRDRLPEVGRVLEQVFDTAADAPVVDYQLVSGADIRTYLDGASVFSLDFETTNPKWNDKFCPRIGLPVGFSVSRRPNEARYTTDSVQCIADLLADPAVRKVCHNVAFDVGICQRLGLAVDQVDDTMVMAYILRRPRTGLKMLSWTELGRTQTEWKAVEGLAPADPKFVAYAAADADLTLQLYHRLVLELQSEQLFELYWRLERPLPSVLAQMHETGIPVDESVLDTFIDYLEENATSSKSRLVEEYPYDINWNSSADKRRLLYGPKRWEVAEVSVKKGRLKHAAGCDKKQKLDACSCHGGIKTGAETLLRYLPPGLALPEQFVESAAAPSSNMRALRALRRLGCDDAVLIDLEFWSSVQQSLRQSRSIKAFIQPDGRLHPTYIQAGAYDEFGEEGPEAPETGRVASRNPNVMALLHHGDTERPYMVDWAKRFRRAFVASLGWTWVKVDVSREEPIIGYLVSDDEVWKNDVTGAGDAYKEAAAFAFQIPFDEVDKEQRQIGKRMAMAWLNRARGAGIRRSATWLTKEEAEDWCESMDKRYSRLTDWHRNELVPELYKKGYVETMFGRRCWLRHVWEGPPFGKGHRTREQTKAEMECVPMVVQGTAADLLKLALVRVHNQLDPTWATIVSCVHDELNLLVRNDKVAFVCNDVLTPMLDGLLSPLLGVEVSTGPNWSDLNDWEG